MLRLSLLVLTSVSIVAPAIAMARPASMENKDDMRKPDDTHRPDMDGFFDPFGDPAEVDAMALSYVCSIGVDSFHWYRNDSIGGDTFDIDSMSTNVAAPFQIAVELEGSWEFTVHSATSIYVYTAGLGTSAVSAGPLILGDGYHLIYNDTAAGGSELHLDVPGPSPSSSGSGSGSGSGPGPGPSSSSDPLWDEIEAEFAYVEWKMVDGRLQYRFVGNNAASNLLADLHQPGGTGDIDVSYIGDSSCSSLSLPAELTDAPVSVPAGHHYFEAGTSGDGPWTLHVSWGFETCDEDINRDGVVNIDDLMAVVIAWGTCP